ncbi:MAG: hypothetical protein EA418_09130 [Wenzhouxiangellaceae bacterium]|nr:MAG: hypothetical protein EA418_09130 [Wenzhouxiangellaceae bacterium]
MCAGLVACGGGPRQVRGELPLVMLETLSLDGEGVVLQLAVRNINDTRLQINRVNVELRLDSAAAASLNSVPVDVQIPPRGRDMLHFEAMLEPRAVELLAALENNDRNSVGWQIEITFDPDRGRQRSEGSGFLHPVPGQPGRFR